MKSKVKVSGKGFSKCEGSKGDGVRMERRKKMFQVNILLEKFTIFRRHTSEAI